MKPFMGLGVAREIYSGYEPSRRFAHTPYYWLEGLIEEGVILSVNELYRYCKKEVDVKNILNFGRYINMC